ncbi:MAG: dihydroorotate dehydrogenase electron transfer subunit [Candidatus Hydrothermales bacterium]
MKKIEGEILNNIDLGEGMFHLIVSAEEIAKRAKPGQFVNIRILDTLCPFIRRPYSIWSAEGDVIEFLIKVSGLGSRLLSERKRGKIDLLGPLGRAYPEPNFGDNETVLIGGGTGIAPLMFYVKYYSLTNFKFIYGAKTCPPDYLISRLGEIIGDFLVSTEDGSLGFKGLVVDYVKELIRDGYIDPQKSIFILCGPLAMLKSFQFLPPENTYVSMEGKMACGFGVCMGCAVKRRDGKGYLRTCTDGTIFRLLDIEL